jgi:hypothetical protein
MRFYEFGAANDDSLDKFVVVLKNYIGKANGQKVPAKLNWPRLNQILQHSGSELTADYETFKVLYDTNPIVQRLVKNFNDDGVELNVPNAPSEPSAMQGAETPQQAVDQQASAAVGQQLDQYSKGVQA